MNKVLNLKTLFFIASIVSIGFATPPWMDIGTYWINDYRSHTDEFLDLRYTDDHAQYFWQFANSYVGGNSRCSDFSDTTVYRGLKGPQTISCNAPGSTTYNNRDYNDFIFFAGHGLAYGNVVLKEKTPGNYEPIALGGSQAIADAHSFVELLTMGNNYNKWAWFSSCDIFYITDEYDESKIVEYWEDAFGPQMQAILGFRSLAWDHAHGATTYDEFWYNWVVAKLPLAVSFFFSEGNRAKDGLTGGVEMVCMDSGTKGGGGQHYCLRSYENSHHISNANEGKFNVMSYKEGVPTYGEPLFD